MSYGVDVIIEDTSSHPCCQHGPTLLFQRYNVKKTNSQKFFACSAHRDRKGCSFFQLADVNNKYLTNKKFRSENTSLQVTKTHEAIYSNFKKLKAMKKSERCYCHNCSCFVWLNSQTNHKQHEVVTSLNMETLNKPSYLLKPLTNNNSEAQFLFTDKVLRFLMKTITNLKFTKVLCVGCPRFYEFIANHSENNVDCLLLDIDSRYENFFGPTQFCHYNLFNHHFFRGDDSKKIYCNFLKFKTSDKLLVMLDPPFGGLTDVIAHTLGLVTKDHCSANELTNTSDILPTFWFFPYFMERRVIECLIFTMLDYQVDYDNHSLFKKGNESSKRVSPVRIFTNIDPATIYLPSDENYRFCDICQRYVSAQNKHCTVCNACTSKDGYPFKHCNICNSCFKITKQHCEKCNRCLPTNHTCGLKSISGCHKCGDITHKRKQCPLQSDKFAQSTKIKKKFKK